MTISIDESIQKLKAEIISQDWNLPQKRIEQLEPAFFCLKQRFKTRKNVLAILTMADNVLHYVKKKGRAPSPDFIDFLKETMAHVVNIYEDNKFDPESEEIIFKRVYGRFNVLKQKTAPMTNPEKLEAQSLLPPESKNNSATTQAPSKDALTAEDKTSSKGTPTPSKLRQSQPSRGFGISKPLGKTAPGRFQSEWSPANGSSIRVLKIGSMQLGIPEENIAMIRPLSEKDRKKYLQENQVPLKDFCKFMRRLSSQFTGSLAAMKDRTLKGLVLPLIVPKGIGLLSVPDENAAHLLVLTAEQRHGVIYCSDIAEQSELLNRFQKGKNGDIAGLAFLEDEKTVPLLNTFSILEREGFVSLPS